MLLIGRGLLIVAALTPSAAFAQPSESEQRLACGGDVIKLCFIVMLDRVKVSECMLARRLDLSPACVAVVDATLAARPRREKAKSASD